MVIGSLKDCDKYASLHPDFAEVFEFLKTLTAESAEEKTVLRENDVWVKPGTAVDKNTAAKNFEVHRNFIDVQYIIDGEEEFGYSDISKLSVCDEYNPEKDVEFLIGDVSTLVLKSGDFCILFPEDGHIPTKKCLTPTVKRAVAKVRL